MKQKEILMKNKMMILFFSFSFLGHAAMLVGSNFIKIKPIRGQQRTGGVQVISLVIVDSLLVTSSGEKAQKQTGRMEQESPLERASRALDQDGDFDRSHKRKLLSSDRFSVKSFSVEPLQKAQQEDGTVELYKPSPLYPKAALEQRLQGDVILKIETNEKGWVERVHLEKSSGHDILDSAAVEGVRVWRLSSQGEFYVPFYFKITN